jgi:hypothetical protein
VPAPPGKPGSRRWLVQRRRIGPVIRALEAAKEARTNAENMGDEGSRSALRPDAHMYDSLVQASQRFADRFGLPSEGWGADAVVVLGAELSRSDGLSLTPRSAAPDYFARLMMGRTLIASSCWTWEASSWMAVPQPRMGRDSPRGHKDTVPGIGYAGVAIP